MEMQNIQRLMEDYVSHNYPGGSHPERLLAALLESWARERDRALELELLRDMVLKNGALIQQLVEMNHLKNKFLGTAAHDLRNPLISIRGLSEIILTEATGPLTQEQKEYTNIINTVSSGMLKLVGELLDISVIESGRLELQRQPGALHRLVSERIRVHTVIAEEKRIVMEEDLAELPDCSFDLDKIGRVIDNLLSNAIKFSPPGSRVSVLLRQEENMARVSVGDEGPGIPMEDRSRIFGEFQKSAALPTGGEKSTGLGLAIAKKIVEAHGGDLMVESREPSGSLFCFTLPIGRGSDGH
jgi:signal transduction histidine kinase